MRALGAIVFVLGGGATGWLAWAIYAHGRPRDVVYAVAAPVAIAIALLGLIVAFVPGFLG